MKLVKTGLVLAMAAISATIASAAECHEVSGKVHELIIPGAADPNGRVLGTVEGTLNGSYTAVITKFITPPAPFVPLDLTTFEVFLTKEGDMLTGTGAGTFTPIPNQPPGFFTDKLVVTVTGGNGKYLGATGTITFEGTGANVFAGPGVGTFDLKFKGTVCTPNINDHH
jgi:hypothetical protein